ncbi:MAG: hypothetical protein GC158_06380 [Cyanobacteria bacterium RI_101]|nr:hypothetical protein [Cyanobacteria bacterium RI_101]
MSLEIQPFMQALRQFCQDLETGQGKSRWVSQALRLTSQELEDHVRQAQLSQEFTQQYRHYRLAYQKVERTLTWIDVVANHRLWLEDGALAGFSGYAQNLNRDLLQILIELKQYSDYLCPLQSPNAVVSPAPIRHSLNSDI